MAWPGGEWILRLDSEGRSDEQSDRAEKTGGKPWGRVLRSVHVAVIRAAGRSAWTSRSPGGVVAHCSTGYEAGGIRNLRVNAERGWF